MASKKSAPARNYRDAGSGKFVPASNEKKKPDKTVSEPRTSPKKK